MNNELTAKVRLDTGNSEKQLQRLIDKLTNVNKAMSKVAENNVKLSQLDGQVVMYSKLTNLANHYAATELKVERARQQGLNTISRTDRIAQKLSRTEYERWWAEQLTNREAQMTQQIYAKQHPILNRLKTAHQQIYSNVMKTVNSNQRLFTIYNRSKSIVTGIANKVRNWWTNQKMVQSATQSTNSLLDGTLSRLRGIAATYLGIMGTKAIINVSDTMTSAENKLNYTNATALGASGYNADGSYSAKTLSMTQETMDKMYASSQKVRMSYTDMMTSVSKMMALAGDAFQGNTDNAIRFQEIMAEAYTVGGASAQEMSSSMYQLTQALGAGVLAGDELRSVREGAPLAYKAIEEFAQGVYNTTDSLKDMGSQGLITSEMVVAAIMNAGTGMDNAFAQTYYRFDQVWTQIQNAAKYAFKPVSEMLRNMLNDAVDNGLIKSVEEFMTVVSKTTQVVITVIGNAMNWVLEHWDYVKAALIAGLTTLVILLTSAAVAGIAMFVATHWRLMLVAAAIFGIVYALQLWQQGAITTCQVVTAVLLIIAAGLIAIALLTGSVGALIAAGVILLATLIFTVFEQICGGAFALGAIIANIAIGVLETIMQSIFSLFVEPVAGIIEWFVNAWNGAFTSVGGAFANFCGQLLSGLIGLLKPFAKMLDKVFGWDVNGAIESAQSAMRGWGKTDAAVSYDVRMPDTPRFDVTDAFDTGYNWGAGVKGKFNNWGAGLVGNLGNKLGSLTNLDNIAKTLGLDLSTQTGAFPNANDAAYTTGSGYNPELLKGVGGIGDDTSRIADSMELTEEDLEYLKRAAELEWKKEYTIAEIVVDMTNHNNISKDMDIDTMYGKLTDKLYEELATFADGVYA